MRVAAVFDIHANLPALEAVLEDLRQEEVDQLVVGGDVLPGPMPLETIECLLRLDTPVHFVQGNGDREVLAQMEGRETDWYRTSPEQWREPVRWTAQQLYPEHQRLLAGWNKTLVVEIRELGDVLFCHSTPHETTLRYLLVSRLKIASCQFLTDSMYPSSSAVTPTCSLTGGSEALGF
jgi:predicted phosphodiesterase